MNQVNINVIYLIIYLIFLGPEILEMKELEEHLQAINDQVKIRRKLLKDFTENKNFVRTLIKKKNFSIEL
jgi:hypothetical protein